MSEISAEAAGIVALIIFGAFILLKLIPAARPKESHFKCHRCSAWSPHTPRSVEAWRNKKTTFFCQACHAKWLQSRPPQAREIRHGGAARGGCLGMFILLVAAPIGAGYLFKLYI